MDNLWFLKRNMIFELKLDINTVFNLHMYANWNYMLVETEDNLC